MFPYREQRQCEKEAYVQRWAKQGSLQRDTVGRKSHLTSHSDHLRWFDWRSLSPMEKWGVSSQWHRGSVRVLCHSSTWHHWVLSECGSMVGASPESQHRSWSSWAPDFYTLSALRGGFVPQHLGVTVFYSVHLIVSPAWLLLKAFNLGFQWFSSTGRYFSYGL